MSKNMDSSIKYEILSEDTTKIEYDYKIILIGDSKLNIIYLIDYFVEILFFLNLNFYN